MSENEGDNTTLVVGTSMRFLLSVVFGVIEVLIRRNRHRSFRDRRVVSGAEGRSGLRMNAHEAMFARRCPGMLAQLKRARIARFQ